MRRFRPEFRPWKPAIVDKWTRPANDRLGSGIALLSSVQAADFFGQGWISWIAWALSLVFLGQRKFGYQKVLTLHRKVLNGEFVENH